MLDQHLEPDCTNEMAEDLYEQEFGKYDDEAKYVNMSFEQLHEERMI